MNSDRYLALIGYEWRLKTPLELVRERRRQEYYEWMANEGSELLGKLSPIDDDELPF